MDDATRYVLIAGFVLVSWFVLAIAGGYIVHKTAAHRKRLFRGHLSENEE